MGVRINPCYGCPLKDGCDLRDQWREKLAGLGLRTAWFVCPKLKLEVRPGRRITIRVPVFDGDDGYEGEVARKQAVKATITTVENDHSFASVLDPGQISDEELLSTFRGDENSVRFRRKQAHRRVEQFLDEPDMPLCANGNVVRDGKCDMRDGEFCGHSHIEVPEDQKIDPMEIPF